jgi:hypothetical protein
MIHSEILASGSLKYIKTAELENTPVELGAHIIFKSVKEFVYLIQNHPDLHKL